MRRMKQLELMLPQLDAMYLTIDYYYVHVVVVVDDLNVVDDHPQSVVTMVVDP